MIAHSFSLKFEVFHLSLSLERVNAVRLYYNFYLFVCLSLYAHACRRVHILKSHCHC